MKHLLLVSILFLLLCQTGASAQVMTPYGPMERTVVNGDTLLHISLPTVFVFAHKAKANDRRMTRLIYNLKIVYPIAKEANATLKAMEARMDTLPSEKARKAFVKSMENVIKIKYTPVLREMTLSQGKLLIKLIDRETDHTSYELVKQLRGGFRAFFWQSIARLFGANLKATYDPDGEDQEIEELIMLYEAGLL